MLMGLFLLVVSMSRSAYVAVAIGAYYIFWRLGLEKTHRKLFNIFLIVVIAIFIFVGAFKPTLFDRPYFVEAILGIVKNPLGLGMGHFLEVSTVFKDLSPSFGTSIYTHNIILEFTLGMGIFSIPFFWWLIKVLYSLIKDKKTATLFSAIFLALFANFLFDITYSIPVFVFLWFISLGLAQKGEP